MLSSTLLCISCTLCTAGVKGANAYEPHSAFLWCGVICLVGMAMLAVHAGLCRANRIGEGFVTGVETVSGLLPYMR